MVSCDVQSRLIVFCYPVFKPYKEKSDIVVTKRWIELFAYGNGILDVQIWQEKINQSTATCCKERVSHKTVSSLLRQPPFVLVRAVADNQVVGLTAENVLMDAWSKCGLYEQLMELWFLEHQCLVRGEQAQQLTEELAY
jgi:hypothetical protein